jgi:hypothetical protein
MDLEWDITGYYNYRKGSCLYSEDGGLGRRPTFERTVLSSPYTVTRKKKRGIILRLHHRVACKEKVELTMAVMLNELFKTIFPRNYNDISAFVLRTDLVDAIIEEALEEERPIADIIPSFAIDSITPSDYPEIILVERSSNDRGLLSELVDQVNLQNIFDILYTYLGWENSTDNEDNRYLLFGGEEYPSLFDIDGTLELLNNLTTISSSVYEEEKHSREGVCLLKLRLSPLQPSFSWYTSDG